MCVRIKRRRNRGVRTSVCCLFFKFFFVSINIFFLEIFFCFSPVRTTGGSKSPSDNSQTACSPGTRPSDESPNSFGRRRRANVAQVSRALPSTADGGNVVLDCPPNRYLLRSEAYTTLKYDTITAAVGFEFIIVSKNRTPGRGVGEGDAFRDLPKTFGFGFDSRS